MAQQQANIFEEGIDRFQSAFRSVEEEIQKLQDRVSERTQEFTDRAQKEADKVQKRIRKLPAVKRAEKIQKDAVKQMEANTERFLGRLPIASEGDIKKLERKINALNRKLKALEKAQSEWSE